MKCFIGCSSYNNIDKIYFEDAIRVSNILINKKYDLVFGCCNNGLMGCVYNEFKKNNSSITAVCTEYYKKDLDNVECIKILVKDTVEQLNEFMKSDLIIFLPGGYGTYNELFYLINSYVLKEHKSKIIVLNTNNYYEPIKKILSNIKEEKFASVFDFVYIIDTIEQLYDII